MIQISSGTAKNFIISVILKLYRQIPRGNLKRFQDRCVPNFQIITHKLFHQKNGAVSKVNKKFISHFTRAQRTPSAAATVQVSHALPAVRFSCLLRGPGTSFQDGVVLGKCLLCAPF
jgi:hypothetical protein